MTFFSGADQQFRELSLKQQGVAEVKLDETLEVADAVNIDLFTAKTDMTLCEVSDVALHGNEVLLRRQRYLNATAMTGLSLIGFWTL